MQQGGKYKLVEDPFSKKKKKKKKRNKHLKNCHILTQYDATSLENLIFFTITFKTH